MNWWTALSLGLLGSLHCAGMCGPLALALPASSGGRMRFVATRLAYNAGRVVTYSAIGVVFGLVGQSVVLAGLQRWLSIALGVALLAGYFAPRQFGLVVPVASFIGILRKPLASLLSRRSIFGPFALGLLNGLLPCGLVYVAGAAAASTGDWRLAVEFMALFGVGTIPMMLAMSLSWNWLPNPTRLKLASLIPIGVALLGALLILRGLSLGIPYLSPVLSNDVGHTTACH